MRGPKLLASIAILALLGGCTVGRDYAGPPAAPSAIAAGAPFRRADAATSPTAPAVARWWEVLGDPTLNALETRALAAGPDLAVARARVAQARAGLREQRANRYPNASVSALYAHAHIPGLDLQGDSGGGDTSELNLYNLGLNTSWEIDLFGGNVRATEAARADAEAALARVADAQVSLTAQVADAYVNARERQRRRALSRQAIATQERMLALTRQRYAAGTATRLDVERLSRQLEGTRADEAQAVIERDAYLDALAALTGDVPGAHDAALAATDAIPLPPASVAIGDPAALLRRRPDIRAAERALARDTAKVGQTQAARFPRLSIMGIVGIGGSRPADLSHLDDYTALLAPQLSWSLFDFGRAGARLDQARGAREEAEARYQAAVLTALRDAEDALSRFGAARGLVATLARSRAAAGTTLDLTRQRYRAGTTTLADVLEAERQQLVADQDLARATGQLTLAFVAVEKALGLGWDPALPEQANEAAQPRMK